MTNSVILYGTTGDGSTLPVQVDATGRLIAEGLQGPPGEQGEPGIGELPPNPQEGQVLGWENGELVWMDQEVGGFFFELDYLVAGGGGDSATGYNGTIGGGGAGGFYHSIVGQFNPNGAATPGPMRVPIDANGVLCTAMVGGPRQATTFAGPGWNITMNGGGSAGGDQLNGASGAGGLVSGTPAASGSPGGTGDLSQGGNGYKGGTGDVACWDSKFWCNNQCSGALVGGGGGGAGGHADRQYPGPGLPSSITGENLFYCAGGAGTSVCSTNNNPAPDGANRYGSGGGFDASAQPGVIILRYPTFIELTSRGGDAVLESTTSSESVLTVVTGGYASLHFKIKPGTVTTLLIDYLRRLRD